MELTTAAQIFTALVHPGRLSVFRLLLRLHPQGGRPTEMAETLGLKPNTLSHHLSDLEACGLIASTRQGRALVYSIDLTRSSGLAAYLVTDCLRGRAELPGAEGGPMSEAPFNVLFICSGNSARSIFAEAILNRFGGTKFRAFSAGTKPGSQLNPFAVEILDRNGLETSGLRAKHVSEFQAPDAPRMDFVFTVCDAAAAEDCAPWPGQPLTAHWGVADPVKAEGTEAEKGLAFAKAFGELHRRITAFAALPVADLDRLALQRDIDSIARS